MPLKCGQLTTTTKTCSEGLFNLIPAAEFHLHTTRHKLGYHPHHLDVWRSSSGFQGAFFHVLQSCGMNFLVRCFRDDTTWLSSKRAPTPSSKAGNAPVIPLVLQEIVIT
ncbi:unnamed protein product [Leptidea sinapis]|uniref:Uncharacterized protein n=1 Tax=Leptidea sinapis TaxID=189913 RepID=A0A5E4Q9U4_9NEOP|nr:unnamed protein product [Leptidea sinapis]